jgi:hypothetical protein
VGKDIYRRFGEGKYASTGFAEAVKVLRAETIGFTATSVKFESAEKKKV